MQKIKIAVILSFMVVLLNSCLLTFYPIYNPSDVVFDPALVGSYTIAEAKDGQPDGLEMIRLDRSGINLPQPIAAISNKGYLVKFTESNGSISSEYIAFMVTLNKNRYIDFYPYSKDAEKHGTYAALKVPMHAIYRISLEGNRKLSLRRFNQEYLSELIDKRQIRINHENIDGKIVVTATTQELQQYIIKYGSQEAAYQKESENYLKK
jgi:hypothetical protein